MTNSTGYENLKGAAFENLIINEIRKQNPYSHTLISHKFDLLCRNAINLNMFNMGTIKGRRIAVEILYCSKVVTPKIRAIQKQAKEFGADKLVIVISCDNKYQSNTLNDANTVFVYENNLLQNANYREFKNNFTQYLENSVDNNNNLSVENSDDFVLALGAGVSIPSNISNWNTLCAALGYELFYSNLESDLPKYNRNILAQEVSNFIFAEFDRDSALDTLVEFFLKETHNDKLEYYNILYKISISSITFGLNCHQKVFDTFYKYKKKLSKYWVNVELRTLINLDIFEKHQYFMTTHSNMVLDASADANINMSIFKFKKMKEQSDDRQEKFTVEQCNNGDTSLLNELGVRNSSVFLSNCSIWVEGITDRLYLKHYLKLYVDKFPESKCFRENLDYTFIEYGGGNLVHFNFAQDISSEAINAKYINNKIFLIADNDNTPRNSKKAERKDYLKKVLVDNFYELPVMEIENLITQETLKKILISQNRDKEGIICQKLNKDRKFQHQKLGKFIDGVFNGELRKYASASGTINNKLEFCKKAIEVTTDYDQLSFEAKALTEKIYNFIEQNSQI